MNQSVFRDVKGFSLPKAATHATEDTKTQAVCLVDERYYIVKTHSTIK